MEFTEMRDRLISNFNEMTKDIEHLFEVSVDKDEMWNTYLDSFPAGTNEIYRERREHDCSCCRQFIKTIGNAVTIKDKVVSTIWDFRTDDTTFQPVLDAMSAFIKRHAVSDIYVSKLKKIGTMQNYEELENGQMKEWSHFFLELPDKFVDRSNRSEGDIRGGFRDTRSVFKRSLDEIDMESLDTILELITSNTLYKGEEWKGVLTEFRKYKKDYDKLTSDNDKELYAWEQSVKAGIAIGRIRNHSIGTLLVNVSEGMDLDTAVKKYEQIVAPANYKRPKEIFTKKMLEDAKKTITELGYMDSLGRRFATLDDITINNILFSNKDSAKRIGGSDDIFGEMEREVVSSPKKFSKVEEIPVDKFVSDVLPTASEVEAYFENKHIGNMVSLIAPKNKDAKTMFKWDNNFGWAYAGNMTDSMKERVKAAGGKVDGDLRFSIQWNEDGKDNCDVDAHCIEPNGYEIYYDSARKPSYSPTKGQLDVDIICPGGRIAVENITWADRKTMKTGTYKFFVRQFSGNARSGFRAEIEFDGQVYSFDYNKSTRYKEDIQVAEVTLHADGTFTIKEMLPSNVSSREVWNLHTNQFVPVSVICYSPNWWDTDNGVGHKHVFFMLKDCINPEQPNGMFNEYLKEELLTHKRVFAALGSKMHVEDADDQLSGIGFSTTKRDEVILKVKGKTERVVKVKF